MKQIAIVSGKGGTGKTTLSSSLGILFDNAILADCDVDAANLNLMFNSKVLEKYEYYGGKKAIIDHEKCNNCGICKKICRFEAIVFDGSYKVDPYACEGCNACVISCPQNAINLEESLSGKFYYSTSKTKNIVHGNLTPGEETSGGLVAEVRKLAIEKAKNLKKEIVLIDGAPGIGCPATSSIAATYFVIIVTEPTSSGIHDLKRIIDTVRHFKRDFAIVINKYDINEEISKEIESFCQKENISILGKIPFDETVENAILESKPIVTFKDSKAAKAIMEIYKKLIKIIKKEEEA
ncbi:MULTISPECIES: ATP-binding protein [unclassified Thermosipho (in: thermotogales)]|uniref:ATP-binding protein n=1 Tax=unclassified Thermosipho (in: thermotogales) TaxID=2676525 RepID=UPI00098453E5|nr:MULTISPECIES: ATP-binding protein [unclassified Thermosipho (in: thermotogales)]MBT1247605.1 (4Fe-4S)-binding protein [Thermosipho sp. 1244]OOC46159.1 (4Fe-4S)-binding protein [Thermosipho sp. 1223]